MESDDLNPAQTDITNKWLKRYAQHYNCWGVETLASRYRNGRCCRCIAKTNGSFNLCFEVVFDDGLAWAVRFPIPGRVMYPDEKVRREAAILKFVGEKTKVPVPKFIAFGLAADNHDAEIGPYIITEWVDGISLTAFMQQLPDPEWGPVLREDINDDDLYRIYSEMSDVLLELSMHDFDKIGALQETKNEDGSSSWSILARPMTQKMNEIESDGYVVVDDAMAPPFDNVTDYFHNILRQNTEHLYKQRNSVDNAEDARNKFILRHRLKALVPYFVSDYDSAPFKLFCDDMRPGNVIIDKDTLQILAVLDWEWTYAAPRQFIFSPPPWLILERPTVWIDQSEISYREKFLLFIKALEKSEEKRHQGSHAGVPQEQRMSTLMRRSMDDGTFWFVQLLDASFNFDGDRLWPGLKPILEQRGLLDIGMPDEEEIEAFVAMKMKDLEEYNRELESSKQGQSG